MMNSKNGVHCLRVADDIPKQKLRLCVSEHPFGTVKRSHGAYYFLCKRIQKTSAEAGLSFLAFFPRLQPQWKKGQQGAKRVGGEAVAYNMKRAINMKGGAGPCGGNEGDLTPRFLPIPLVST